MSTNSQEQFANELKSKLGKEGMQRLSECKTKEEAMQVISDAGVEIPDEMMEGISGGELFQTPWNPWFLGTLG